MEILTREQAKRQGKTRFFTGTACRNGHVAERMTKTNKCVMCKRESEKRRRHEHRDQELAYRKRLRALPNHRAYANGYAEQLRRDQPELVRKRQQEWYNTKGVNWFKTYRGTLEGRKVTLLANIRARAISQGLDFDLTHEDLIIPTTCPVLGIDLMFGEGQMSDSSPSVDRVDNTKGYVKGNVHIISMRANRLKSDATLRELELILQYVRDCTILNGDSGI